MPTTYEKPSEALANIPGDGKFIVRSSTPGRPKEIPNPNTGGKEWDKASFQAALADERLPRDKYIIRQLDGTKVSRNRITLDLSLGSETTTLEGPGAEGAEQQIMAGPSGGSYLQESVVGAMVNTWQQDRDEIRALRDDIEELIKENHTLDKKCQDLEHQLQDTGKNDSVSQMVQKVVIELARGPAAAIAAHRFLGPGSGSGIVADAVNKAAAG